jgi:energy-coupling factor transporter ATP-binding protein EcfA2
MIRLESISISRFRGIREGAVKGFADVNLMIGRNNCGKSTVAEAITAILHQIASGHGRDPINRSPQNEWQIVRKSANAPASEFWYKQDQSQPIKVDAQIADVMCSWKRGAMHEEISVVPEVRGGNNPVTRFARQLTIFRPPDGSNQNVENTLWVQLLADRRDKALKKALNDIFTMKVDQLQLLPNQRFMVLFEDYSVSLDAQGDGARSALRCLMMLTTLRDTLFIIEEPECHQHPGSLERFAEAVCRQAREQQVQLLVSTHSLECVQKFIRAAKVVGSICALFHLKLEDGVLRSTKIGAESEEAMEASGIDPRFLDIYG